MRWLLCAMSKTLQQLSDLGIQFGEDSVDFFHVDFFHVDFFPVDFFDGD